MIEAICGYVVMSQILGILFIELEVNKAVFEILFGAVVVIGILLMACSKRKGIGTGVFVGGVAAYVIVCMLIPYADTVARWGGVVAALALVIVVKTITYQMLHRRTRTHTLKWWQTVLIYMI